MNELALCAGCAGITLGLRLAAAAGYCKNPRVVCYVEREAFAAANLVAKIKAGVLDDAPIWSDVATFGGGAFRGLVDILTAGFPCQPWSAAGRQKKTDDDQWLWPAIFKIICDCEPEQVFLENVPGLLNGGIQRILWQLSEIGYNAEWGVFSATTSGAPHIRKRLFLLANPAGFGLQRPVSSRSGRHGFKNGCADVPDPVGMRQSQSQRGKQEQRRRITNGDWWQTEPALGRVVDGYSGRVDELRLCGNGVVPAVVARAYIELNNRRGA